MLGIVAALPTEAKCLLNTTPEAGTLIRISSHAMLRLSGIGPDNARSAAESLLSEGATSLLSWGCAGALDPMLKPGSLMLPKKIIASSADSLEVDANWHQRLYLCLSSRLAVKTSPITTSPSILTGPAGKAALYKATSAVAVDMESAPLADAAREHGIPFMVVRAIADAADTVIPADLATAMSQSGRISPLHQLTLLLRPWLWPVLTRLRNQFQAAMSTLAIASNLAGPDLLAP